MWNIDTLVFHKIKSVPEGRINIFFSKRKKKKEKRKKKKEKRKKKKKNRGGRQPDRLRPFVRGSIYRSQNWTFVMPRIKGGRTAPHRDMSRARHDQHESSKLEHQIWVGGC
jgi:hypothetical protein